MVLQLWVHTAVHSPIDINVLFFSDKNTGSQLTIIYIYIGYKPTSCIYYIYTIIILAMDIFCQVLVSPNGLERRSWTSAWWIFNRPWMSSSRTANGLSDERFLMP